ncbi:MAG: sulfate reduction electron transfer complex DsrMKJOP subunit DsrM [Desulfovibrionaceae bacterium]
MNAFYSLIFVFALVLIALFGVGAAHLSYFFGVILPLAAVIVFIVGIVLKVLGWGKSAVPFRIPTTGGQQQSLDWIKQNKWDNPSTASQTFIRMLLEVLLFRSLFRNTSAHLYQENGAPVVGYRSAKWLWLFSLLFHYSFLIIVLRHLRLFMEPIPFFVGWLDFLDGIMEIGAPRLYMSDILIVAGVSFLLLRRMIMPQIRYISNVADYFPLLLILGIALSGIYMRYFGKVDVVAIKELTMGLVTLNPKAPANIDPSFYVHLTLVSVLLIYFPFSKLMHLGGVFLSPTRNMPNNTRIKHHENPWNPDVKPHSYEAYEDDFREAMVEAGLPVEKKA